MILFTPHHFSATLSLITEKLYETTEFSYVNNAITSLKKKSRTNVVEFISILDSDEVSGPLISIGDK